MEITRRKHKVLCDVGIRRIIYPLDTTFIHDLPRTFETKCIEAGWDIEKTTFLEIDYPTTPLGESATSAESIPSHLFSGIVYAWSKKVYFKLVAFSKGYFDVADDLKLKADVWHEKQHVIDAERFLHKAIKSRKEYDIVKETVEYVLQTFGEEGREAYLDKVLSETERFKNSDTVLTPIALFWLREYFGEHYEEYAHNAFSIPSTEHAETYRQAYSKEVPGAMQFYMLNYDVSKLFKYTWEDIKR